MLFISFPFLRVHLSVENLQSSALSPDVSWVLLCSHDQPYSSGHIVLFALYANSERLCRLPLILWDLLYFLVVLWEVWFCGFPDFGSAVEEEPQPILFSSAI